jgi:hypothetical protein
MMRPMTASLFPSAVDSLYKPSDYSSVLVIERSAMTVEKEIRLME